MPLVIHILLNRRSFHEIALQNFKTKYSKDHIPEHVSCLQAVLERFKPNKRRLTIIVTTSDD